MSIEQADIVDFVTIDPTSGDVLLTISDHLGWDQEEEHHLVLLQGKLNAYLRFIESGEIFDKFPDTRGRKVVIQLVSKFQMSKKANQFFECARIAIEGAGFRMTFELFRPN